MVRTLEKVIQARLTPQRKKRLFHQMISRIDMATVFCNGVFDCWHPGHINILLYARELAGNGKVIVAIDECEKVMIDKGLQRPIFNVHERAKAILDLKFGDRPVVNDIEFFFSNQVLENIIRKIKPDILLKGSDWEGKKIVGEEFAKQVVFYPRMTDYSTTEIIRRVMEKNTILK